MTSIPAEAVQREIARGDEARRAAAVLLREGLHRDAMSRAYYAALHYARALLLVKGEEPRTHEGVLRRFSLHFVRTAVLTLEEGKILGRLHKLREEADYGVDRDYAAVPHYIRNPQLEMSHSAFRIRHEPSAMSWLAFSNPENRTFRTTSLVRRWSRKQIIKARPHLH